jgi:hypothetical protein
MSIRFTDGGPVGWNQQAFRVIRNGYGRLDTAVILTRPPLTGPLMGPMLKLNLTPGAWCSKRPSHRSRVLKNTAVRRLFKMVGCMHAGTEKRRVSGPGAPPASPAL